MSIGSANPSGATRSKGNKILWGIVTGLLAGIFVLSGTMKFVRPEMAEQFARWGYADWFRILIGVVEIGGGLALLLSRAGFFAATVLAVVMAGAVFTHLRHGETAQAPVTLVLFGLLGMVAYVRRPRAAL
jgi:uncharacterized membrane protein YphA (DoxX/SURF4 family)